MTNDLIARAEAVMDQLPRDHRMVHKLPHLVPDLITELRKVTAERDAKHEQVQDMLADQECACGYDNPTDVCLGHLSYHRKTVARAEAAKAEVATLRAELDDAKSENASRSAMFATVSAELDAARGVPVDAMAAEALVHMFHNAYEELAPDYGYETRAETKVLDLDTPNGRLMTAVCARILAALESDPTMARMQKTLEWYGNPENYNWQRECRDGKPTGPMVASAMQDKGNRARAALQEE
jgi:hypothetical protein